MRAWYGAACALALVAALAGYVGAVGSLAARIRADLPCGAVGSVAAAALGAAGLVGAVAYGSLRCFCPDGPAVTERVVPFPSRAQCAAWGPAKRVAFALALVASLAADASAIGGCMMPPALSWALCGVGTAGWAGGAALVYGHACERVRTGCQGARRTELIRNTRPTSAAADGDVLP